MIFINFKTYKEATGVKAVELVKILSNCQAQAKIPIIPVVQSVDIRSSMIATLYTIWAQNIDFFEQGQYTGSISPEAVAEAGATGTFLNHSEHKIPLNDLEKAINRSREAGLGTLVFASNIEELEKVIKLKPTYAAYEPSELIASKDTSVAQAKPDVIKEAVGIAGDTPLLVGAGIKTIEDVVKSLELGAQGVVVSSAVVLANDPKKVVMALAEGFTGQR